MSELWGAHLFFMIVMALIFAALLAVVLFVLGIGIGFGPAFLGGSVISFLLYWRELFD